MNHTSTLRHDKQILEKIQICDHADRDLRQWCLLTPPGMSKVLYNFCVHNKEWVAVASVFICLTLFNIYMCLNILKYNIYMYEINLEWTVLINLEPNPLKKKLMHVCS